MDYFIIEFESLPVILFAHYHTAYDYKNFFPKSADFIEITYVEKGPLTASFNTGSITMGEECLLVATRTEDFSISSSGLHKHLTVGIRGSFKKQRVSPEEVVALAKAANERFESKVLAVVPAYFLENQNTGRIHALLTKIVQSRSEFSLYQEINTTGLLLQMLAEITKECIRQAFLATNASISPSSYLYCENAVKYISDHIGKKISLDDVAKSLGISAGYLSSLFKAVTGQSLVEYINRIKVNRIKELLANTKITLRQAGESVGISDENYISRLFKKYVGCSVSEYKASLRK